MRFHDTERIESHTDDDQEGRAAEERSNRPRNLHSAVENLREKRNNKKPRTADERDARHDGIKILCRRKTRTDAGQIRTILLEVLGDVDRIELRGNPEESKEHDERSVHEKVHRAAHIRKLHEEAAKPSHGAGCISGDVAGEEAGDLKDRLSEDDRHDARVVDTQRHERLLHAVGGATNRAAAGGVNRNLADTLSEQNRTHHHGKSEEKEKHKLNRRAGCGYAVVTEIALPCGEDGFRKTGGDVDHDDQRRTVSDTERGDLVSNPHDEERGRGHTDNRHKLEAKTRIRHNLNATECGRKHFRMHKSRGNAPRLHNAEENGQITGDLRELLTTRLTFLLHLLKRRNHRREKLNHNLSRNVGPD